MAMTIRDIAREAGVSTATVSRALRGLPNVDPVTRERVRQVAERLDYVVSPAASRLASGRAGSMTSIMVWRPRSSSSMKPCWASQARMPGTKRPASCIRPAMRTKGSQFSLSGGASMMMRLPALESTRK